MKQSLHPSPGNLRVFVACLLSFTILITPIAAVAAPGIGSSPTVRKGSRSPASSEATRPNKARSTEEELFVNPPTAIPAPALPGPQPEPAPEPLAPPVPGPVTATMTGALTVTGNNGNGQADPGDTINYTAILTNTGSDPTGLISFNDFIDPHTTFVPGSIKSTPVCFDQPVSTNEDVAKAITLTGQDPDGDSITFSIVSGPSHGSLNPGVAGAAQTYTPTADYNGPDSFVFRGNDGTTSGTGSNGNSNQDCTVAITVIAVNDAPTFTVPGNPAAVNEDSGAQSVPTFISPASVRPAQSGNTTEDTQTVSFVITNNTNTGLFLTQPAINVAGVGYPKTATLTYTPAANQNGTAVITYHAHDDGGTSPGVDNSADQTFTITVNAVNDPPVVVAPAAYSAYANMKVTGLTGLLGNVNDNADNGVNGCSSTTFTVTSSSISATSPAGGVISNVNLSSGTFDFDPPPGITGDVTFTYTVSDTGCPGVAISAPVTVHVTVSGTVIWFVNPGAGPDTTHTGTLSNPFQLLASANTAMGLNAGQRIFVYTGTTTAGVGVTLTTSQWLVGQGAIGTGFDTLMGITPPANTIGRPTISTTGTSAANRPTIQGKVAMNGSSTKVLGINITPAANIQGLTATNGSAPGTGTALTGLQLGASPTSDVIVSTTGASGSNAMGVSLTNAGGNFNFISVTTNGGLGISADTIGSGSTMNFGPVSISNRSGTGVFINNAQGTITFGATTIPNPADAGGYGIRIDNSSATVTIPTATISDPHTVTGQTDPDTDLIPNTDGDGDAIFLKNNTGSFTLSGGTLSNCGNDCIDGRTVQTLTLTNVTIDTPGQETGGQGAGGHGISLIDVSGTSNLTGLLIKQFLRSQVDGFRAINTNKNATVNVINCRFENTAAAGASDGNDGLFFEGRGTSNMTTVVDEASPDATHFSRFQGLFGDGIQISTGAVSTGKMTTTVKNTDFKDAYQGLTQTGSGNNGLRIAGVGGGKHAVDIQNNTFLNVNKPLFAQGVISLFINDNSEVKGTIAGNTITNATQAGIQVFADNAAGQTITDMDLIIQNNTLDNISSQGIIVQMTVTGGTLAGCDFRILNNNIGQTTPVGDGEVMFGFPGGFTSSAEGILFSTRGTPKTCNLKVANNNVKINANGVNAGFPPSNEVLQLSVSESATLNATVQNNQLLQLDDIANGAAFFGQSFGAGTPNVCLDFTGNTGNTNVDFFLQKAAGGSFVIENVANVVAANTGVWSPANPSASGYANSAGCAEPPVGITQLWVPDKGQKGQKGQKDYLAARPETALQNSRAESLGTFLNTRTDFVSIFGKFPGSFHGDTQSAPTVPTPNETLSSQVIAGVEGWRESSESRVSSFEFRVKTEQDNQKAERDAPARVADAKSEGAPYGSRIVKASYELDRGSSPRVSKGSVLVSEAKGALPDGRATAPNAKVGNRNDIRLNHARRASRANNSTRTSSVAPMPVSGGTFPINGTGTGFILPAGKSTTIKFSVTLNNPPNLSGVPPATPQVANHGTLSGSFSNNPVDTNTVTTNVDLFDSTTTVTSLPTSSNTGQPVTFTAAIGTSGSPSGSGTNRTGTVNFKSDGTTIPGCGAQTVSSNQATCTTSGLSTATHVITAEYSGDGNFDPSNGTLAGGQVVTQSGTTTTVTSSLDPSLVTQNVTFTATVASATSVPGPPTGTVQFKDNGVNLGSAQTLNGSGVATLSTSALIAGTHPITAVYSGDTNFTTSTGTLATDPQDVNKSNTTTLLASSVNPSTPTQNVTFTATVSSSTSVTGPPTGTVTFMDGANPLVCDNGSTSVQTLSAGAATCDTNDLTTTTHSITAVYGGDPTFNGNTSNTVSQVVSQTATTTALVSSQNPSSPTDPVTFTATVSASSGTPTGTVTFNDNGSPISVACTNVALTSLQAQCTAPANTLSEATHPITAVYSGDTTFSGSTSNTVNQVVTSCSASVVVLNINDSGPGSLRQAITSGVCEGGTITFDPVAFAAPGPYTISLTDANGELLVGKSMTITGPGAGVLTVKRVTGAGTNFRVFEIAASKIVTISGMTISNGRVVGAVGSGGGPALGANGGSVSGGGVLNAGTLTLLNTIVSGNQAIGGVGEANATAGGAGGDAKGGGVYNSGTLTLTNTIVNGSNSATGGQGGDSAGTTGSGGNGFGGGVYTLGATTLTLNNSTIASNAATGGAAGGGGGTGGLAGSGSGGGIYNDGTSVAATARITNSTISGNTASLNGGGIANVGTGTNATLTITNSTISGNFANNNGGGVYNDGGTGTTTLTSVTVTNNRADNDNDASGTGGGINVVTGTVTLRSTIVAGNFNEDGVTDAADDIAGTVDAASSFNLIGTGGAGGLVNATNNNQVGVADAKLGALANNGGPTQTHALLDTSPALETGNNFALTTLNGAIDNLTTTVTVTDASTIPAGAGFTIRVDSEQMVVVSKALNVLTVTRGANGTTAASHLTLAPVYPAFDQRGFSRTVNFDTVNSPPADDTDIGSYERPTQPAAPNAPDLDAASDTGTSSTDNITSDTSPTFTISGVTPGATVELLRDTNPSTGILQVETATVAETTPGTLTAGNARVIVTAAGMFGSPKTVIVALATNDDEDTVAGKIRAALAADTDVSAFFTVSGSLKEVVLTAKTAAANDPTMNIDIADDTSVGLTAAPTSANTTAGAAGPVVVASGNAVGTSIQLTDPGPVAAGNYIYTARQTVSGTPRSPQSAALNVAIDNSSPTAPDTPDLVDASDTGLSITDNITSDTTPTFNITSVTSGFTVDLLRDGNPVTGIPVVVATGVAAGTSIQLTDPSAPAGTYTYTSRQTNGLGNSTSSASALTVTIDTTPPAAPGTPNLQDGSDTFGVGGTGTNTDNITNAPSLSFDVAGTTVGATVQLFRDATLVDSQPGTGGAVVLTDAVSPGNGTYAYTARQVDTAGNFAASAALSVQIDKTGTAAGIPDLRATSDSFGPSGTNSDNITNVVSRSFDIPSTENGSLVELYRGATFITSTTGNGGTVTLIDNLAGDGTYAYTSKQTDIAGNAAASSGLDVTVDTTPNAPGTPDLQAGSDTGTLDTDNLTGNGTHNFDISAQIGDFVELLRDGVVVASTTATLASVTLSDSSSLADGLYHYTARQTDVAGNVATSAGTLDVTVDGTKPSVSMTSAVGNPTSTTPIPVTVTFNEPVTGFTISDIVPGNGTVSNFAGGPAIYTFDLTPSSPGAVSADIAAGVATDTAGNTNTAATQFNRTFDPSALGVSITAVSPDPRNTTVTSIQIVFNKPVTGFDLADLSLTLNAGGNLLTVAQTLTSGDNMTWTLNNLGGLTGAEGTYVLKLTASGSGVIDAASNPLTSDATETWVMDTTAPSVTVSVAAGQLNPVTGPTASTVINFTVVFSESVTDFINTDVNLSGAAGATVANVSGSGTTYNVAVEGMTSSGAVTITIPAAAATDAAGNGNTSVGPTNTATVTFFKDDFTTLEVNTVADTDDGSCAPVGTGNGCTLREAINAANTDAGADTITFNAVVFAAPGPYTINLTGALPDLSSDMTISGPGANVLTVRRDTGGDYRVFTIPSGNVTIDGLTISNGNSVGLPNDSGGGILSQSSGTVNVTNSTISGNTAVDGGGIRHTGSGTFNITNSTISGNSATSSGGINVSSPASVNITNSTISGNFASANGGGAFVSSGTLIISNSTITNNRADNDTNGSGNGGGIFRNGGTVTLRNTIVGQNFKGGSPSTTADDIFGTVQSDGFNLIQSTSGATITETLNPGTNITGQDPLLNPLADNGGPTFTHALQCTSPAIDKGFNFTLTTDQRGGVRPFDLADAIYPNAASPGNGSDIGAYETQTGGGCLPLAVAPVPAPSTNEETPVVITLKGTYSQNFALSFAITQQPAHGSALTPSAPNCVFTTFMTCTSTVTYTPVLNFNGLDSFKFKVSASGLDSEEADVNITVIPVNDPPVANGDVLSDVAEDSGTRTIPFADLTANDSPGPANEAGQALTVISVSSPLGGTVGILGNDVLFTPTANYHGPASFQYKVRDNGTPPQDSVAAAIVNFTVTPVADTPSVTNATTNINTQTTSGLVISRNAADGAEVTHFKITNITNGTLYQSDGVTPINDGDFITFAEGNAGLKFTPDLNKNTSGGDTFSFQVQGATDNAGSGLSSGFATATITVNCQSSLVVTSTADDGSVGTLRHAVDFSCPNGTITFNLGAGPHTIPLSSELFINKNLTITGPTTPLTLSGGGVSRVFSVDTGFTVNLSNLTIADGQANIGGGIYNLGDLTISNSTFTGNHAVGGSGEGGAIDSEDGTLTIVNTTISGNTAETHGGGLLNCGNSTTTLINVTITNNYADSDNNGSGAGGGIGQVSSNALTLHNTIVAGNFNEDGATDAPDDVFVNLAPPSAINPLSSHNLIGVDTGLTGISDGDANGNHVGTAATPINARLGPLGPNGGPTQTHTLLAGSPALDAGDNAFVTNPPFSAPPFTDQRGTGFSRIVDGPDADTTDTVDIGAFEAQVSVEDITDKTTNEDTQLQFTFNVGGAASITSVTATSGNTTLVPNNVANIAVSGSGSTRTLTINPVANQFGASTITVTVNGTNSQSMTDTFVLTVNSVNDVPSFTKGPDQTVNEDAGAQTVPNWATNISAGPANESSQTLTFQVTGNTNPTLFGVVPAISSTGTLTYTPAANANGSATITIVLNDNGGTANGGQDTSASQTFNITVNAVNDTPSFVKGANQTVNEDSGVQTVPNWATAISPGPANESSQTVTFNVTNNNNSLFSGQPTVSPTGTLTYTPAANANGTATVSVTISDNGGTANGGSDTSAIQTFTITVNPVNDAPSFTKGPDQIASGPVPQTVNNWATNISAGPADESGQSLTFLVSNNNSAIFSAQPAISPAGTLTYTPAYGFDGTATVTVQLKDNGGVALGGVDTSAPQTFTITVHALNNPPTLDALGNVTMNEDAPLQTVNLSGITPGPIYESSQSLTVTATSNNTAVIPNPTVSYTSPNTTGSISFTPVPDANGSATITVTVKDDGGTANGGVDTFVRTFIVTVNAINDAPVNHVPGSQNAPLNGTLIFSTANSNLISISDVDAGIDPVQVTLKATDGTLTLSGISGLSFITGDGTDDVLMTFTGSIANINAALNGMSNLAFGSGVIEITTNDLGHNGAGGPLSRTDTISITVIDNLAPILLTIEGSDRAIALDSVTLLRDPFSLLAEHNFSSDHRTRITLFALHAQLNPGENASAVTAEADVSGTVVPLTVESVRTVPNFDWLTQVVVKFPDQFSTGGGGEVDAKVRIRLRGANSNQAVITIVPVP